MFVAGYSAGSNTLGQASFLGTCEMAPEINHDIQWTQVMNDLRGKRIPYDLCFQGRQGFVTLALTRWNEKVYHRLADTCANFYVPSDEEGVDEIGDVGTLFLTEGLGLCVWVQFPYNSIVAFQNQANGALVPGYRYPAAIFKGPDRMKPGTDAFVRYVQFHCLGLPDPVKIGRYTLYDNVMTGLPAID